MSNTFQVPRLTFALTLACLLAIPLRATAEVHITVVDTSGIPGEVEVPVDIDFENPDDEVVGFQFNLIYDPAVLTAVSLLPTVRTEDYSLFSADDPGDLMVIGVDIGGLDSIPDSPEPLVVVTFDVAEDVRERAAARVVGEGAEATE